METKLAEQLATKFGETWVKSDLQGGKVKCSGGTGVGNGFQEGTEEQKAGGYSGV